MKVELYHGTSMESADSIMRHGFKDRVGAGKKNWDGVVLSKVGFVYLTRAYPFFYAMNAAGGHERASVLKVVVDTDDLFPDEDYIRGSGCLRKRIALKHYKHLADASLKYLGNVAIRPEKVGKVVGRKDFWVNEMWQYSDPSMSQMNYAMLGEYYRELTDTWWAGGDWQAVDQTASIQKALSSNKK